MANVPTEMTRPPLRFRNHARWIWWSYLVVLGGMVAAQAVLEPSVIRVLQSLFLIAFLVVMAYRGGGVALTATGDEVVIRNFWKTHTVAAAGIRGLDFGRPSTGRGVAVRAVTAAGTIPIDVLSRGVHVPRGTRERFDRRMLALADWLWDGQRADR